jgi:hypothetical protein
MIRRDVRLNDGAPGWMLISQIEHARISAQLASHAIESFGAVQRAGSSPTPASLRQEVLAAILHHDDGWAAWERAPRLDPARHRPLSFTELECGEALDIWTASIEAAAAFGPLAAATVAGPFLRLLAHGDTMRSDPAGIAWQTSMTEQRAAWLVDWQSTAPEIHTPAVAEEALQWLWTFDEVSLWFCTTCPATGEAAGRPASYRAGRGTPVEMQLLAAPARAGRAAAVPWHFDGNKIALAAAGQMVAAADYADSSAMLAAARPHTFTWQVVQN